jgi:hypothetical protein
MHLVNLQKYDKAGEALMEAALDEPKLHGQQVRGRPR